MKKIQLKNFLLSIILLSLFINYYFLKPYITFSDNKNSQYCSILNKDNQNKIDYFLNKINEKKTILGSNTYLNFLKKISKKINKLENTYSNNIKISNILKCLDYKILLLETSISIILDENPFWVHPAHYLYWNKIQYNDNGLIPPKYSYIDYSNAEDLWIWWDRHEYYALWDLIQPTNESLKKSLFDWSNNDYIIWSTPNSINILLNIGGLESRLNFPFIIKEEYYNYYIKFLKELFERYDWDWINDMPNLKKPIKYWQILNEPDCNSQYNPSWYANLVKITKLTMEEVCLDCKLIMWWLCWWKRWIIEFFKPVIKELKWNYFDIFDIHYFVKKNEYRVVDNLKYSLIDLFNYYNKDIDIWITETWIASWKPRWGEYYSEKIQASELIKIYVYNLSNWIKKVFWAYWMIEWFWNINDNDVFDNTWLIYDWIWEYDLWKFEKKLSFYSLKLLIEKTKNVDWNNVKKINEDNDLYIYKFKKSNKNLWIIWNDNNESKTIELEINNNNSVLITEAVPKYENWIMVKNYNTEFNNETKKVKNWKLKININDVPIFVEN